MTVIFPYPDDEKLAAYLAPFGRMMFGYGRAMVALREVAISIAGDERDADAFMFTVNSKNMVEKFRNLCTPHFESEQLNELLGHCKKLAELHRRRNRIVHGEWWFDIFTDDGLAVRHWDHKAGRAVHDETVTPESLDMIAHEFAEVSSDIDMFTGLKAK